jgi:hypothetical protein
MGKERGKGKRVGKEDIGRDHVDSDSTGQSPRGKKKHTREKEGEREAS